MKKHPYYTIPELFEYIINGSDKNRDVMMNKVNGKYQGITVNELHEQTESFAFGLTALGIHKNDKVAIIAENRPEWVYSDFAITGLGIIDVPMYPSLTSDSIEYILNNSESKAIIISNKFQLNKILKIKHNCKFLQFLIIMNEKDMIPDEPQLYTFKDVQNMGNIYKKNHPTHFSDSIKKVKEDDLCTIIYTSGTTGEPKGVMLTHNNIVSNVRSAIDVLPVSSTDVFLSYLPLCHIFERMAGYYTAFSTGGVICYAESIETVAQNLLEVKPTIVTTVPRLFERIYSKIIKNVDSQTPSKQKIFWWGIEVGKQYAQLKKSGKSSLSVNAKYKIADKLVLSKLRERTGGNLRFFISGGAALPKDMGDFFEAVGLVIIEGYGLTESSPVIACNRVENYKFGTVGLPFPGVDVKIADDGEILARGPNIMQGYYKNKKETAEVLINGWLHTGDIGMFDDEGFLHITDRKKHLFKTSAGKYIAPTPIENMYLTSKYIDQFLLIGDKKKFLTAFIVPDFDEIKVYAKANNINFNDIDDLVKKKEVYDLYDKELAEFQKKMANYEKIRKYKILSKPFTQESGEMTPSLKLRRKIIETNYSHYIDEMYS